MRKHHDFILTPVSTILEEVETAVNGVVEGMDSYPLFDYIMQSAFLKMTGFQEQKMKCICWEVATDDYKYRYERFKQSPLGEGSSYKDKKIVVDDLLKAIRRYESGFDNLSSTDLTGIFSETRQSLIQVQKSFADKGWAMKTYYDYELLTENWNKDCLVFSKSGRLDEVLNHCENCGRKGAAASHTSCKIGKLREIFDRAIEHRNRCAHNTLSYQRNLPSLDTMENEQYVFDNYFLRFAMIMIFDGIYMKLYKKYTEVADASFEL
ncbi:MAG: hypothetical protein KBT34_05080 [Prevotella sp.]|nr:hypothetical protein [Candidatus Prevotella equi]